MINQEALNQIQHAPITERIQIIELLLQSLKNDLKQDATYQTANQQTFTARQFHLGEDITPNREELYENNKNNVCD